MPHCAEITQALNITIDAKDLPLCCPLPGKVLWNAHPRVYLKLSDAGHVTCPYCGTHYQLTANSSHD